MNPFKWRFWLHLHRDPLITVVLIAFALGLCAVLIAIFMSSY
jgi:hypothetical protein